MRLNCNQSNPERVGEQAEGVGRTIDREGNVCEDLAFHFLLFSWDCHVTKDNLPVPPSPAASSSPHSGWQRSLLPQGKTWDGTSDQEKERN